MRQGTRVYETLKEEIVSWRLAPGSLLTEVEIASRVGASRTPIREALARLVREGLVRPLPGRGLVVTEVSVEGVAELFQMREALEIYATRLAARNGSPEVFTDLHERLRVVAETPREEVGDLTAYYALSQEFDDAVAEATRNSYLRTALHELGGHQVRLRRLVRRTPDRAFDAAAEHMAICAAIREHDENGAARAVAEHIRISLDAILAALVEEVAGSVLLGADSATGSRAVGG
ncbi:GntR family transcriptional regulator [Nocardiopsis ansamitocini]|uniref:GntR family transcriptional regulator n=1 Tax=Nocardiopsis ansamitocini TaxID=1670832 RepID=A0A9W6P3W3_9ACTN|nr:GntR family transcriptional regulator [Nocardiopsis ansamitocini]GLU46553.1 GntR family transcriptional regulator [Nocardiopsis ansamitocini]